MQFRGRSPLQSQRLTAPLHSMTCGHLEAMGSPTYQIYQIPQPPSVAILLVLAYRIRALIPGRIAFNLHLTINVASY